MFRLNPHLHMREIILRLQASGEHQSHTASRQKELDKNQVVNTVEPPL